MDGKREFSLYVHVPFCRSKCPYCAFYSFRPRSGEVERWTDCIVKELAAIRHGSLDDAQLATVQNDVMYYAYTGTSLFEGEEPFKNFSAVAGLYDETIQIITCDESIQSVADLAGAAEDHFHSL